MPAFQQDRKLVEVFNMTGGLNTSGDPSSMAPNEWRDCQNMMVARPRQGIGSVGTSLYDAVAVSHPSVYNVTNSNTISVAGSSIIHNVFLTKNIITGQNNVWPSETWTAGGTGTQSYQNTFSNYMNQCVQHLNTASQTTTSTITISTLNISSFVSNQILIDTNQTGTANFSSGYIRIGTNSTNYYQYNLTKANQDGITIYNFIFNSPSLTVGSPSQSSISYVQISTTATAGGSFTFQFNNLRIADVATTPSKIDSNNPGVTGTSKANIRDIFVYDKTADGLNPLMIICYCDCVAVSNSFPTSIGTSSLKFSIVASGFTNWTISAPHNYRFNFSQMPDFKNSLPNNNVFYFVNGADGFFSYNANASAGSGLVRISATTYKYIQNFKNYMMLGGRSDKPNQLDWSDLNDPSNLTTNASGNITVPFNDSGQTLTGLMPFDDYMFLFRSGDVWIFSGNSNNDFAIKKTKSKIGAIDQKYITKAGMQVYFANFGGIFCLNWWDESNCISKKVSNLLQSTSIGGWMFGFLIYNPIRDILVYSIPGDFNADPVVNFNTSFRLTFSIPQSSYGGNIQGGSWGKLGKNSSSDSLAWCSVYYSNVPNSTGSNGFLSQFFEAGTDIYQWDASNSDAISMTYMIRTAWHTGGHPRLLKNIDKFGFWNRTQSSLTAPTNPTIQLFTGFSDTASQTVSTNTTPVAGYSEILATPNSTQAISASISTTGTNQTTNALEVSGYSYVWTQDQVI